MILLQLDTCWLSYQNVKLQFHFSLFPNTRRWNGTVFIIEWDAKNSQSTFSNTTEHRRTPLRFFM